jgi:hypothetical protein
MDMRMQGKQRQSTGVCWGELELGLKPSLSSISSKEVSSRDLLGKKGLVGQQAQSPHFYCSI